MLEILKRLFREPVELTEDIRAGVQKALSLDSPRWTRPVSDSFEDLSEEQCLWMQAHSQCCYCGGDLFGGPSGGASQNMYCGNVDTCNSAFNLSGMIPWGQFIGGVPKGFKEWRKVS